MSSIEFRKDTFRVTLTIDGVDFGVWDAKTGGKVGSSGATYRRGGMGKQIALGGPPAIDALSLSRLYDSATHDRLSTLIEGVGKADAVVKQLPLDPSGNAYGHPIVWTGRLTSADPPEHDGNSTDAALLTVEVEVNGNPTA